MVAVFKSIDIPRRRALVVDDSRIARHVLSGMLDRLDFDVEAVDSAEAALDRLSGELPHIVFMDHLLPGMQGLEAVRRLRARADIADMRIVMYTSQDGELFADVARTAGADDVFVKTADRRALDEILGRLDLLPHDEDARRQPGNVAPLRPRRDPLPDGPASGQQIQELVRCVEHGLIASPRLPRLRRVTGRIHSSAGDHQSMMTHQGLKTPLRRAILQKAGDRSPCGFLSTVRFLSCRPIHSCAKARRARWRRLFTALRESERALEISAYEKSYQ